MYFQLVNIVPAAVPSAVSSATSAKADCIVDARELLRDVASRDKKDSHAYLIVDDGHGNPIGIVGTNDIRCRIGSPSFAERKRWMNMPVETAINGRFCFDTVAAGNTSSSSVSDLMQCTVVSQDDRLMALVTPQDVLVSWRSIEKMVSQSQKDHVTELPTRSVFDAHLRAECMRARRDQHSVGVIMVDVDLFKEINDQFGHAAGDSVLNAIGQTLRNTLRSYDMVSRFGGDEFAVLCCGCRPGEIENTIQRLRTAMHKLQCRTSLPCPVPTVSIGACVAHDLNQIERPDQIIENADECLYFSKREGRNRSFTTELGVESAARC
jgi:diguanylate cyclase (GGDEF)-like protein